MLTRTERIRAMSPSPFRPESGAFRVLTALERAYALDIDCSERELCDVGECTPVGLRNAIIPRIQRYLNENGLALAHDSVYSCWKIEDALPALLDHIKQQERG